jgi:hypothetical protein
VAHSSSPRPTGWSGVRTAGTPARTAVRITELSVRTSATANSKDGRTRIVPTLRSQYEAFLAANGIEVAGIEFIRDAGGAVYTYDVNTDINYNPDAEARAGRSAMAALARFLGGKLQKH